MKKLLILLFSILISFNSNAKWTKATEDLGDTYYFDYGSIKKNNGNIFVWMLIDQYAKDATFIPEIWQGHKNDGAKMWDALGKLEEISDKI